MLGDRPTTRLSAKVEVVQAGGDSERGVVSAVTLEATVAKDLRLHAGAMVGHHARRTMVRAGSF